MGRHGRRQGSDVTAARLKTLSWLTSLRSGTKVASGVRFVAGESGPVALASPPLARRRGAMLTVVALMTGLLAVATPIVNAAPAEARFAESGLGLYKGAIDWFEWGTEGGQQIPAVGMTRTNTRMIAGQALTTTCSITGIVGQVETYTSGTWVGDAFDDLYNIGGADLANQMVAGLSNRVSGETVSFDFACGTTLNGVPVPLQGLVFADAEASNAAEPDGSGAEFIQATPNQAATWRIIDRLRSTGCATNMVATRTAGGTLRLGPDGEECVLSVWPSVIGGPTAVGFMEGATSARVTVSGGGKSAVALGVMVLTDFGDAPASYGEAGSLFQTAWQGGTVPVGSTAVSPDSFTMATPGAAVTHLGALIDSDREYLASSDALGDDLDNVADEDAIAPLGTINVRPGTQYTLPDVQCTGPGFVAGWIDWNHNGSFDAGERSDVVNCTSGSVALTWTVPMDTQEVPGAAKTFLRLRIAADAAAASNPTGITTAGEVEDHALNIALPHLAITKTSNATTNSRVGDTVTYTVTATNIGTVDYTAANPVVVFDDLSEVLDDATYNNDGAASKPGTVSYLSPLLSWTGALAAGASVDLTYTATLKGGGDGTVRNVAWIPADPENPVVPDCAPPVDGADATTAEPCAEVKNFLPKLTIAKAANRTELPAIGDTVEYTVTVTNAGPGVYSASAPATMTDDLTNVLDAADYNGDVSASIGTATVTGSTLDWSGPLGVGESAEITYSVTYTGGGDLKLKNTACVPAEDSVQGAYNCDSVTIPGAGLTQWKQVSSSDTPAVAGSVLTYTLFFSNEGETPATVDAVDNLSQVIDDATVTGMPVATGGLSAVLTGDQIAITGSIGAGQTETVTYQVTVKADGERGDDIAANFLLAPNDVPPTDPECVPTDEQFPDCTVTPIAAIAYSKSVSASSDPVVAGTVLTYTVKVVNTGEATAPVSREDALAGVLDDATLTAGPTSDTASVTVSNAVADRILIGGALAAGQTALITYEVTVKPDADRGDNQADNFLVGEGGTPPESCVDGSDQCTSTPIPLIEAAKSSDPASGSAVVAGQDITYALTFSNTGKAEGAVDYTDNLADVLDDATLTSGPTSSDAALTVVQNGSAFEVTGALAAGQTVTVSYTVKVKADGARGDNLLGNVLASSDLPDPECGDDGVSCTEHPVSALRSWKSVDADPTPVAAGSVLTYTLSFENIGQGPTTVDKVDDLTHVLDDADVTSEPVSADGLTVVRDGDRISITGDVPVGETYTVTYQVTVKADGERGDDIAANFLMQNDPDNPPVTPTDPVCVPADSKYPDCTVTPIGSVTYEKSVVASADPVEAGTVLTYTVTVRNTGQADVAVSREDVLADVLDDATLTSAPVSDTASVTVSGVVGDRFEIGGTLAAGETALVTYEVTVKAQANRGNHVANNFLVVPGEEPPTDCVAGGADCTSTPLPLINASKSSDPASGETVAAGQEVTYTLTFSNTGTGAGTVDYTDNLVGVIDDASLTAGPTASDAVLTPVLNADNTLQVTGVLTEGQTVTVSYTVTVLPDGQRGDNRLGNVLASSGLPDPECGDDGVSCTEHPVGEMVSWKTVEADVTPVAAGTVLTYTLSFENIGQGPAMVNEVDDLTHVLDDADVSSEPVSADGLTVVRDGDLISITGDVPVGETYTVTYQVTVKADGERGDDIAANFLMQNDPDNPPVVPEVPVCQPADSEYPDCTVTPIGQLLTGKSVSADTDPIDEGTVLTYTLTFDNQGEGPITVDQTDILTDVLDDAALTSAPASSDDALSVSDVADDAFTVTGELAAGQTVTVTYQVTVNAVADRGNNTANNFLIPSGEEPPVECVVGEDPNCTVTPLPLIGVAKSADPVDGSGVNAGQVVTYTLTFANTGAAAGALDYTDDLAAVLDDADLTGAPTSSDPALVATDGADGAVRVTGMLAAGQTVTVSYSVTVKADGARGDNQLRNVVAPTGTTDPECGDDGVSCTEHPVGELVSWKTVDPTSGATLLPGEVATYTLHFENTGNAPVDVNQADVLTQVLDDADVTTQPVASSDALTVSDINDGQFAVTGTLQPDQLVTVTYAVTVKEDGARGDDRLVNFLVSNGTEPPAECVPTDQDRADCTFNHVSDVAVIKSSDPVSGTKVEAGDDVTYTLTFTNRGTNKDAADVAIDYTDHMVDVLDDATLTGMPVVSNEKLTTAIVGDTIRITGAVPTGKTITVTYTVTVKAYEKQGNHALANVVAVTGAPPVCVTDSPLCTTHDAPKPVVPPVTPPGLPMTGGEISAAMIIVMLVLLGLGGVLTFGARRRKTAESLLDESSMMRG